MAHLLILPAGNRPTTRPALARRSARRYSLSDGQTFVLRPVHPEDAAELLALFGRLSAKTLRRRFFTCRQVELAEAQSIAGVGHYQREAVVTCLGREPAAAIVGLGSYDQTHPGAAEIVLTDGLHWEKHRQHLRGCTVSGREPTIQSITTQSRRCNPDTRCQLRYRVGLFASPIE
jgi:hypothetical protein